MVRITKYFNFFTELILLIFLFLFSLILFFLGLSSSEKESARKVIKKLKKQNATTDYDSAIHFATRVRKLIQEGVDDGNGIVDLKLGELVRTSATGTTINYGADQASIQRTDRDAIHSTNNYEIIPYWRNATFDFSEWGGMTTEKEVVTWMRNHATATPYV